MKSTSPKGLPSALIPPPKRAGALLVFWVSLVFSWPLAAQAERDIITAIQSFVYDQTQDQHGEVRVEVLESSTHFPACLNPRPFLPRGGEQRLMGRVSIGIRCNGAQRTARYVPVHIRVMASYIAVATAVKPGTTMEASMLEKKWGDLSTLPRGVVLDQTEAIGQLSTQRLRVGTVLQQQHLRPVPVVERGARVAVEIRGPAFVVSREGEALEGGGIGESIRVRLSRREILNTVIIDRGRVRVASVSAYGNRR